MKGLFAVAENEAGERLDVWLCKKSGLSRSQVKRALNGGGVRVNGRRVYIAGWKLSYKDRVEIMETAPARGKAGGFVKILCEDKDIIVVDKPAGILSVRQEGSQKENLVDRVHAYLKRKYKTGSYLKPIHRLDAETSGAIVFAKSKIGERLEEMFRRHNIERKYIAVVEGRVETEEGKIEAPLEKGKFGGGRKVRTAEGGVGREATTEYRVKERYTDATLLEVRVATGRTHQIRVHLASIGHPVVGDKLYGGKTDFSRHALHASVLGFKHPANGRKMRFESPLPKDLRGLIDQLRGI